MQTAMVKRLALIFLGVIWLAPALVTGFCLPMPAEDCCASSVCASNHQPRTASQNACDCTIQESSLAVERQGTLLPAVPLSPPAHASLMGGITALLALGATPHHISLPSCPLYLRHSCLRI